MIDRNGFRLNVGIILANSAGQVFWGKRVGIRNAWQFPQGGVNDYETLEETMYRELQEETGLKTTDIEILGLTRRWLYYRLPKKLQRPNQKPACIGQKQKWYLLQLTSNDSSICLDSSEKPEFSSWRWVEYWYPLQKVIYFKHEVYKKALTELAPLLPKSKE